MAKKLTKEALMALAKSFCQTHSKARHPGLFGVIDGKAVATYVERLFQENTLSHV